MVKCIFIFCCIYICEWDCYYNYYVSFIFSEVEFQQVLTVPTFNSWFPLQRFRNNYVFVIQEDKARSGNLLVGTINSLLSVPLEDDGAAIVIAGNPNFTSKILKISNLHFTLSISFDVIPKCF